MKRFGNPGIVGFEFKVGEDFGSFRRWERFHFGDDRLGCHGGKLKGRAGRVNATAFHPAARNWRCGGGGRERADELFRFVVAIGLTPCPLSAERWNVF